MDAPEDVAGGVPTQTPMAYTPTIIRKALIASMLSYAPDAAAVGKILRERDEYHDFVSVARAPEDSRQQYVVVLARTEMYVALRGTSNLKDWMSNIQLHGQRSAFGKLHAGFARRAKLIELDQIVAQANGRKIIFCGHSLGGACAQIVTLRYIEAHPTSSSANVACIAFGAPFVGTTTTQRWLRTLRGQNQWSRNFLTIVNGQDCVPGLLNIAASVSAVKNGGSILWEQAGTLASLIGPALDIAGNSSSAIARSTVMDVLSTWRGVFSKWTDVLQGQVPDYVPIGMYQFMASDETPGDTEPVLRLGREREDYADIKVLVGQRVSHTEEAIMHHNLWQYAMNYFSVINASTDEKDSFRNSGSVAFAGVFDDVVRVHTGLLQAKEERLHGLSHEAMHRMAWKITDNVALLLEPVVGHSCTDLKTLAAKFFEFGALYVVVWAGPFECAANVFQAAMSQYISTEDPGGRDISGINDGHHVGANRQRLTVAVKRAREAVENTKVEVNGREYNVFKIQENCEPIRQDVKTHHKDEIVAAIRESRDTRVVSAGDAFLFCREDMARTTPAASTQQETQQEVHSALETNNYEAKTSQSAPIAAAGVLRLVAIAATSSNSTQETEVAIRPPQGVQNIGANAGSHSVKAQANPDTAVLQQQYAHLRLQRSEQFGNQVAERGRQCVRKLNATYDRAKEKLEKLPTILGRVDKSRVKTILSDYTAEVYRHTTEFRGTMKDMVHKEMFERDLLRQRQQQELAERNPERLAEQDAQHHVVPEQAVDVTADTQRTQVVRAGWHGAKAAAFSAFAGALVLHGTAYARRLKSGRQLVRDIAWTTVSGAAVTGLTAALSTWASLYAAQLRAQNSLLSARRIMWTVRHAGTIVLVATTTLSVAPTIAKWLRRQLSWKEMVADVSARVLQSVGIVAASEIADSVTGNLQGGGVAARAVATRVGRVVTTAVACVVGGEIGVFAGNMLRKGVFNRIDDALRKRAAPVTV